MLTNIELEALEKKYFDILSQLLERHIGQIITQIYSQRAIRGNAIGAVVNVIESAVENILEALIANQLHWNVCSMPVASDSCFECGDAIVHVDAKTVIDTDNDNIHNKINVEASQTTYIKGTPVVVASKNWEPKLNQYEDHTMFGEVPNLTYFVKVIYSDNNLVEKIKLISAPHGQLGTLFGGASILGAGKIKGDVVRGNIRFKEDDIARIENWRVKVIYERK